MGCGATKVQVVEEDPVLSSEDKTDECRFFCPLCMLFYERKIHQWPLVHVITLAECDGVVWLVDVQGCLRPTAAASTYA